MTVSDLFKRQIEAMLASFAPGTQLPHDRELARQYGVSIMTVRRVLTGYARQGRVERIRGKGTFVPGKPVERPRAVPARSASEDTIFYHIKKMIACGEMKIGTSLPANKLLCRQFRVTARTVTAAYEALVKSGLICRAGRHYWVGDFKRLSRLPRRREICLLSDRDFDLRHLYTRDFMALSFRKMESELISRGYSLAYEHYQDLPRLFEVWRKDRGMPHGIILTGAQEGSLDKWKFDLHYPSLSRFFSRHSAFFPRMLAVTMSFITRARGVSFFSTSHTSTVLVRTLANLIFRQNACHAAFYFDEKSVTRGTLWNWFRIIPELDRIDDSIGLSYVVKPVNRREPADISLKRVLKGFHAGKFRDRMSKYRPIDESILNGLLRTTDSFTDWLKSAPRPLTVICEKDSHALEIFSWCAANDIAVPSQVAVVTLENSPAYLHYGISACVRDWETIGYCMAHALIGDIPVARSHRGFIEARAQVLHRRTTDASSGP